MSTLHIWSALKHREPAQRFPAKGGQAWKPGTSQCSVPRNGDNTLHSSRTEVGEYLSSSVHKVTMVRGSFEPDLLLCSPRLHKSHGTQ